MSGINPKDLIGVKKAPLRNVPAALAIEASGPMQDGAVKYGPYNWRETPILMSGYIEATERHLAALKDGQDLAEDSGHSHIGHIAANMGILADAKAFGTLIDDRRKGPAADMLRARDKSVQSPAVAVIDEAGATPFDEFLAAVAALKDAKPPLISVLPDGHRVEFIIGHEAPSPEWEGQGPESTRVDVTNRGEWPPDTRVGTLLTCCGASDHTLDCPQYR